MFNAQLMNSKERKRTFQQLELQFGTDCAFLKEYAILFQESKGRIIIASPDLMDDGLQRLRIDSLGLYLGARIPNGEIRLSVEGSQLIGPHATKNVIGLDSEEFNQWMRGNPVEKQTEIHGFVILRHKDDFCGCGKPVRDEKTGVISIHNYVPKTRHVHGD